MHLFPSYVQEGYFLLLVNPVTLSLSTFVVSEISGPSCFMDPADEGTSSSEYSINFAGSHSLTFIASSVVLSEAETVSKTFGKSLSLTSFRLPFIVA